MTRLSFLSSSSLRPEPSSARALAPSSPPSVDLPTPATKPRFLAREPSSAPPPPPQTPSPASPRPESPNPHRSPLEVLEACSTVDPPLRSSSTRADRGNGFMVSSLCFPVFFPFRDASPAPENGRRRRRRTYCRLWRGSEVRYRGRSAWEARTVRRSNRFRPETMLSLVGLAELTADSPL